MQPNDYSQAQQGYYQQNGFQQNGFQQGGLQQISYQQPGYYQPQYVQPLQIPNGMNNQSQPPNPIQISGFCIPGDLLVHQYSNCCIPSELLSALIDDGKEEKKEEEKKVLYDPIDRSKIVYDPNWTVEQILDNVPPPFGWEEMFRDGRADLNLISKNLQQLGRYFPNNCDLFKAYELTPLHNVRVVIFGQDPYPGVNANNSSKPKAQGLAFSLSRDDSLRNDSIYNMFREIHNCYPDTFQMPTHGDLTHWAKQGILLLNACLTVSPGKAGSHMEHGYNLWYMFLSRTINTIVNMEQRRGGKDGKTPIRPIFVLFGNQSQKMVKSLLGIANIEKVYILEAAHPSPMSASKFFGCQIFKKIDNYLTYHSEPPIDWNLPV